MIGVSEATQKLNAKGNLGVRVTGSDMNFVGGWTFNTNGATGNGSNTYWYINYDHYDLEPTMENTHFGTYQTVAGETAAYDLSIAEVDGIPDTTYVVMTADWNSTDNGIFDYDINSGGVTSLACAEPASIMMSYKDDKGECNVLENEGFIGNGGVPPDLGKPTRIFGGVDITNEVYTNRGFGFVTFGRFLILGEMESYQKAINHFETSMSRNIY